MSLKKDLRKKKAQAMLEFLSVSIVITAAIAGAALVKLIADKDAGIFRQKTTSVISGSFGAQVGD